MTNSDFMILRIRYSEVFCTSAVLRSLIRFVTRSKQTL